MTIDYKKSFYKTFDPRPAKQQEKIFNTIQKLLQSLETQKLPKGLGVTLLDPTSRIWEARVTLHIRVVFRYKNNLLELGFVGTHDQVKKYLKNL